MFDILVRQTKTCQNSLISDEGDQLKHEIDWDQLSVLSPWRPCRILRIRKTTLVISSSCSQYAYIAPYSFFINPSMFQIPKQIDNGKSFKNKVYNETRRRSNGRHSLIFNFIFIYSRSFNYFLLAFCNSSKSSWTKTTKETRPREWN